MDLMKMYELAETAGIDIYVRFDTEYKNVTIEGYSRRDTQYGRRRYALLWTIDNIKELERAGIGWDVKAVGDIVSKLVPPVRELSLGDWNGAYAYLTYAMAECASGKGFLSFTYVHLKSLHYRYLDGERTKELYDAMMALQKED